MPYSRRRARRQQRIILVAGLALVVLFVAFSVSSQEREGDAAVSGTTPVQQVTASRPAPSATTEATPGPVSSEPWEAATPTEVPEVATEEPAPPRSRTIVIIGDSITNQHGPDEENPNPGGYFTWANEYMGFPFTLVHQAGVGGNRSHQFVARFQEDVLSYDPDWVFIQASNNDVNGYESIITIIQSYEQIFAMLQEADVRFAVGGVLGAKTWEQERQILTFDVNTWLSRTVPHRGGVFVDWKRVYENSAGFPRDEYTFDAQHPTTEGAMALGRELANVLGPYVPVG